MSVEILTPVGRLVGGHPMVMSPVIDDKTKQPKLNSMGQPRTSLYVGLAIKKGPEQHWHQTEWGAKIQAEGIASWPNGEYRAPTFAWKITDGDSTIPNKKGKIPNTREGWPGHWILHASTEFPLKCYHVGKYAAQQVIQRKEEIKCGDYVRLLLSVKGNNPSESPGVYINPELFELTRAGIEIISDNAPDANESFGAIAPQLPAGAMIDPAIAGMPPATGMPPGGMPPGGMPQTGMPPGGMPPGGMPVAPHTGFVTNAGVMPPPTTHVMTDKANGATYEQMIGAGWNDALLIQHGMMLP